ncbi:MAG: glycosyltransferase, partial [Nitrospirae bacterium]|nr:glycosyltransferase [Nitrospirota bacterium]
MNVVLFSEVTIERVIGGAERVLRQQSLGLAKLGHHVRVIVRAPCESAEATCSIGNVTEQRYPVTRTSEPAFVLSSVQNSLRAFDVMRQAGPIDVGVIHQSLAGLGPILFRYRAVGRWVYVCHSLAHEDVVVLSEFMKRQVMAAHGIGSKDMTVVPGAADLAMFYPTEDLGEVRRELKIDESRRVLFTVRNLVPRMGLEHLIEAITLLGEERRNLLLLIGGEGPLRQRLEELICSKGLQDSVQLLGFVPEEQLAKYYQASDLVVMPTLQLEGFGLVTVEALACGTPVMGTPVGAIPEVLSTVDPLLVTEGTDGGALAKTLRLWLTRFREQPGERERLSKKGREVVERRFNWDAHTAQLDRLFAAGSNDGPMTGAKKVIHVITRLDYGGSAQNTMLTALGHDRTQFEPLVVAGYPGSWDAQGGQAATEENCRRLDRAGVRWLLLPSLTRAVHPLKDLQALWQLIGLFRR